MANASNPAAQTVSQQATDNTKARRELWSNLVDIEKGLSDPLAHLRGPNGGDTPFWDHRDLGAGNGDTINFEVTSEASSAGVRGADAVLAGNEEVIRHGNWTVQIDSHRVAVGENEIIQAMRNNGLKESEALAMLAGRNMGRIEAEDLLQRARQRAAGTGGYTLRPNNRTSLDTIERTDTINTTTINTAKTLLSNGGGSPALVARTRSGMEVRGFCFFGASQAFEGLWQDSTFTEALNHAEIDGAGNPFWTGLLPNWRGNIIKGWELADHDGPGTIGSTVLPKARLGDVYQSSSSIHSGGSFDLSAANTAATLYGGGRLQSAIQNPTVYLPFAHFFGNEYKLGASLSTGAAASQTLYVKLIDLADGKWCLMAYDPSTAFGAGVTGAGTGYSLTTGNRLAAASSGSRQTTVGNVTYSATYNKESFALATTIIVQSNANGVNIGEVYGFSKGCGAHAYGSIKNEPRKQDQDYGNLRGRAIVSIRGSDLRKNALGEYHRHIRIVAPYEVPGEAVP